MGNDCNDGEREFKYMTFHQSIYAIESDIKKELYSQDISQRTYHPFGLVNQGICKKYKFLLNENFDKNKARNQIFNYNDLAEKNDSKDFSYINPKFCFDFPSEFIFINKDFMDVIRDNVSTKYKKLIRTNFDTIIGGGCLIMKNPGDTRDEKPYRYIILYNEIKENKGNEIDFFLYIKDKVQRNSAVNYILKNNLYNYFKHIKYKYTDEYKKIIDENKGEIGYIVRNSGISSFENYLKKLEERQQQEQKLQNMSKVQNVGNPSNMGNVPNFFSNNFSNKGGENNFFNPVNNINAQNFGSPSNNSYKKLEKPLTSFPSNTLTINPEHIIDPIIAYFFQFNEITSTLSENKNLDLPTFKNIIVSKVGQPNIKKMKNFSQAFDSILKSLDPNTLVNKDYYNQSQQYDEEKSLKKFMEEHDKGNFVQKLFLIPKEYIISCKKCGMKTYHFGYAKYIYIANPLTDLIFQKIFIPQTEHHSKGRSCNFCNGQETESTTLKKILGYPEKLIVIIEHSQVNNFNIGLNLVVSNGKDLSYILNQFIEVNTNILYQINQDNTNICHPFGKNVNNNISNKKPIVLFYNLIKVNTQINMNPLNNMPTPSNQTNQSATGQNMNPIPANSQQNGQQNPASQTKNPQVNAPDQNQNQQNNVAMINQQKMAPQMMPQQQNINQINGNQQNINQMNFQQNINNQFFAPQNLQNINNQNFNQRNNFNFQNMNQQTPMNPNNFQNNFNNNNFVNNMNSNNMNNINTPMQQFNNINNNMNNNMNMNGMGNMNNQVAINNNLNNNMMMNNNMMNNNVVNNNMMNNNFDNNMNNFNNLNNNNMNMNNNNMNMNNNNMNMNNNNMNMNNMNMNNMNMNNMNMNNNNMNMNNMNMNNINMNNMNMNNMNMNNMNMNNMNMNNMNMNNINMNNMNMNNMNMNINNMNIINMMGNNNNFGNGNNMNMMNPNANNNNNNQNLNQNTKSNQNSENSIFITFTFKKNKKQIYIDVDRDETFGNAEQMLTEKYNWLKDVNNRKYFFNGQIITDYNKTLRRLKIDENSDISILS